MTIFAHGYIYYIAKTKITKRADTSWDVSALIYFVWKKVLPDSNKIKYVQSPMPTEINEPLQYS